MRGFGAGISGENVNVPISDRGSQPAETTVTAGLAALGLAAGLGIGLSRADAATRFVFANESDYDTMDPHAAFDVGRVAVRLNIYDGSDALADNPAVLEPWVAESHTISADGLTYTFKIRKGVKFHDGTEVKASGRRLLARAHPGARQGRGLALQDDDCIRQRQGSR